MRIVRLTAFLILAAVAVSALPADSSGESRIGAGFGVPNYVLIYRPGNFDFKGGYDFTEGSEFIYLSGAYRFVNNRQLTGPLNLSLGVGGYGKLFFDSGGEEQELIGGMNIPAGVSIMIFDRFIEIFAEIAPGIDLYPKPAFSDEPLQMWVGITLQMS